MARKPITLPEEVGVEIAQALKSRDKQTRDAMFATYTAAPWNLSRDKIYKVAAQYGYKSNKKPRSDKGSIRAPGVTDDTIKQVAKTIAASTRPKLGKRIVSTETVREQLIQNGHQELRGISPGSINRHLNRLGVGHEQMMAGNPAIQMRSEHPNAIHFLDASICVQWDLEGKRTILPRNMRTAFYKNKPESWKSLRKVLVRWLVVDHCSGAFYVDYTYAAGENTRDMLSVLLDAWGHKPETARRYPFHGVPRMIYLDQGPGNTSHAVKSLFEKLNVEPMYHSAGNARASGVVERLHGYWEEAFEWQLLHRVADNLEELRARAHDVMIYINGGKTHARHGMTRNSAWMRIKPDQLRLLPPKDHCMRLATSKPESRKPNEQLRISFNGVQYQLFAPALKNQPVMVDFHPWQQDDLNVWTQAGEAVECYRIETDQYGFDIKAPTFGEGVFKRHPDTPAEALKKELNSADKSEQLQGFQPQPQAHLVPEHDYLPRKGKEIVLDTLPPAPPIPAGDVAGRLRRELGLARITPAMGAQLNVKLNDQDAIEQEAFEVLVQWARDAWSEHLPDAEADRFTHQLKEDAWQAQAPSGSRTPPSHSADKAG